MTDEKATGSAPLKPVLTALAVIAIIAAVLHPLLYWGMFSGDGEIHLIYARNFLRGFPLKFNLGMANSGETSMGYMLVDALLMRIFGEAMVPLVIKVMSTLALYGTALLMFVLGKDLGLSKRWAGVAAICFLLLPGDVYSSSLGTENTLFAILCVGFALLATRLGWFRPGSRPGLVSDLLMGIAAGVLFWIRPEAAPLVAIVLASRLLVVLFEKRPDSSLGRSLPGILLFGLVFALTIAVYFVIFKHYAGEIPYGAGKARRLLSIFNDSVPIFGVYVNKKVVLRLASYFSIVLPAAFALWIAARGRTSWLTGQTRWMVIAFTIVFFAFMGGYVLNVLPSVHFARYSVFVWPFGLLAGAVVLQGILREGVMAPTARTAMAGILLVGFLGVVSYETMLRRPYWFTDWATSGVHSISMVPANRARESAELSHSLGLPVGAPAALAYQEVQVLYDYTDNFQVISLDGITDSRLLHYMCNGWIDHDGYLIDTKVDYVMEFANYNHDHRRWALKELMALPVGTVVEHPGITYRKIAPRIVKVERTVPTAADRPGGICPAALRPFDHEGGSTDKPSTQAD